MIPLASCVSRFGLGLIQERLLHRADKVQRRFNSILRDDKAR